MASLSLHGSDGADDLLFDMYKKEVVKHLKSKMDSDMVKTLDKLKCGGVGTSDLGACKMRLESFLHSVVAPMDVDVVELSEKSLFDMNSRLQMVFGNVLSNEVISGIVGILASRFSTMSTMNEEIEKVVVDLLKFLIDSSCINIKGSAFVTPPLKRKDVVVANSPAAPVKRPSKKFDHMQHPCNADAKVLFPEVEVIDVPSKASKEPIKEIQIDSDVVILKEVTLTDKLNKTSKDLDAMHNKHNAERAVATSGALRKLQERSTTAANAHSPTVSIVSEDGQHADVGLLSIPESAKFPLTLQEKLVYKAICSLANSKHASSIVADIGGCHVKYFSLGESMTPGKQVCTFVVNAMCRKIFLDERPSISKKHYFFSVISDAFLNESGDYSAVQKSFSGAASVLPLPLCDSLLFPVLFKKHWFLFIVDLKTKFFFFLDSYYSRHDHFSIHTRQKLKDGFRHAWSMYVGSDSIFNEFWTGYAHVPKQENEADCGIFVIKFMELWWYGCKMVELFSQEDIPSIRAQISYDLVYCKHNTADIKVLNDFISTSNMRA